MILGARLQLLIQAGPALLADFPVQARQDLPFGTRAQPIGGQSAGAKAHAVADVLAGDEEVLAGVVHPAQHDVGVRVIGIPVVDCHPVQPGRQVTFHLPHQAAGEFP